MAFGFTLTLPTITGSESDVAIKLSAGSFPTGAVDLGANALANGGGSLKAYTDDTKATQVPLEIVTFVTGASPDVEIYALIPTAATGETLYFEDDAVQTTQPAVTSTFGRDNVWADYYAVFHLTTLADSSGNLSDLTAQGGISTVSDSVFGDGYLFATNEYLITSIGGPLSYPLTITAQIIDPDPISNSRFVAGTGDASAGNSHDAFKLNGTSNVSITQYITGTAVIQFGSTWPRVVDDSLYVSAYFSSSNTQHSYAYSNSLGSSITNNGTSFWRSISRIFNSRNI